MAYWIPVLLLLGTSAAQNLDLSDDRDWLVNFNFNRRITSYFKIFLFNCTNPEAVLNGAKPALKEVGPYVYRATWIKDDLKWLDDGSVEFVPKKVYRFLPRLSKPRRQTDRITTVNMPFMALLGYMKHGSSTLIPVLKAIAEAIKPKFFETRSVRELVWGYRHKILDFARANPTLKKAGFLSYRYDKVGLLVGKNFTDEGTVTVNGGTREGVIGEVLKWNGNDGLKLWERGSECDRVRGSDGILWQEDLKNGDTIQWFNRDFCRTLPFVYAKEVTHSKSGIVGTRFVASPDTFARQSCYCNEQSCDNLLPGLFNMSLCQHNSPILMSNPHFLGGDPKLLEEVIGLLPDTEKHSSFFDISPVGVTLSAKLRGQFNLALSSVDGLAQVEGLRDMIFPIIHFSNEIELPRRHVARVRKMIDDSQRLPTPA